MKSTRRSRDLRFESLFYKDLVRASSGTHGARNTRVRYPVPGTGYRLRLYSGKRRATCGQRASFTTAANRPPPDVQRQGGRREKAAEREEEGPRPQCGVAAAWRGRSVAEMLLGAAVAGLRCSGLRPKRSAAEAGRRSNGLGMRRGRGVGRLRGSGRGCCCCTGC